MLYIVLPVVTWLLINERRSLPVALWCIGGLASGVGISMTALRQPEFGPLYPVVTSSLIGAASLLRMESLRLDLGTALGMRRIVLASLALAIIYLVLEISLGQQVFRAQCVTLITALMLIDIANSAWRIALRDNSRSAVWIAWVYLLSALVLFYRTIALNEFYSRPVLITLEGVAVQALAQVLLLAAIIGHFGYVGMVLDRARRRELAAVAERTRADERRHLGEELAHGERQRAMDGTAALLGHELRQPLTAILANAQMAEKGLQSGRLGPEQLAAILEKVVRNTRRADQIVDRVRGRLKPSAAPHVAVDLRGIATDVVGLLDDEARAGGIRLALADNAGQAQVAGDALQLSQVLVNMVRNALQAVAQASTREVLVVVRREDGSALVEVHDTGPGLPAGSEARIGTPFFTTKPDGLGLGLAIARDIARQHQGQVHLAQGDRGGAIAVLSLPALAGAHSAHSR